LEIQGHFAGPFGSGLRNAPIPLACLPETTRKHYERFECRQSIATIETSVAKQHAQGGTLEVSTGDLSLILGTRVYQGYNCIQAWAEFSLGNLVELLNAVRNRTLDFALAIWKEQPEAGQTPTGSATRIDSSRVTQIFNLNPA
jgi:hypothetical protein